MKSATTYGLDALPTRSKRKYLAWQRCRVRRSYNLAIREPQRPEIVQFVLQVDGWGRQTFFAENSMLQMANWPSRSRLTGGAKSVPRARRSRYHRPQRSLLQDVACRPGLHLAQVRAWYRRESPIRFLRYGRGSGCAHAPRGVPHSQDRPPHLPPLRTKGTAARSRSGPVPAPTPEHSPDRWPPLSLPAAQAL